MIGQNLAGLTFNAPSVDMCFLYVEAKNKLKNLREHKSFKVEAPNAHIRSFT